MIKKIFLKVFKLVALLVFIPIFFALLFYLKNTRNKRDTLPRLVWGPDPIISNKYWSNSLKEVGYFSQTVMSTFYSINNKNDFDKYFDEFKLLPTQIPGLSSLGSFLNPYIIFLYCVKHYDIFHIPAHGFVLRLTFLKYFEAQLLKGTGKKIIVLPYGSDFYRYSKVYDLSLRHALLKSYPAGVFSEYEINKQLKYWIKNADFFLPLFQTDAVGRWDVLSFSAVTINEKEWIAKKQYSESNGQNGVVKIIHTPNHRGFKGSEFIIQAVNELKEEGYLIELILLEKKSNSEVKAMMQEADILAEQIIATAYALSGIEGMASGLPVLSNLELDYYTQVFRRYSFLNECPILSTSPENIKENIRLLVENPSLRRVLGTAGREYVEKYHSYQAAQYLFGNIYDKIWSQKDINLLDIYHPLNSHSYNKKYPYVKHPLVENKLPANWKDSLECYV